MAVHHLVADDLVHGEVKPGKRCRKRRVTLDRAMRQANKAAVGVKAATINADGSVKLEFGDSDRHHQPNEWDTVQ